MLADFELLFVTGKGGVGKTSVAAAIAELSARTGRRTLVCEMDAKGSLAAAFDMTELVFTPRQLGTQLFGMTMNTEDSLREYLRLFVKVPLVGRIGPLARTFDFVADAAPGVKEVLSIGKLCYEVRERHYDLVVVDAVASGHIIGHLNAPTVIGDLVHVGLVRDQTAWMAEILDDPRRTGVVVVTTPEEMPVTETVELLGRLDDIGVATATVVANRVLPALFDRRQAAVADRLRDVSDELAAAAGAGVDAVLDAAALTERRRRAGATHLDRLRRVVPSGASLVYVPELFTRASGRRVVTQVADALADELETDPS